jgi:hypothetical protein
MATGLRRAAQSSMMPNKKSIPDNACLEMSHNGYSMEAFLLGDFDLESASTF